MVCRYFLNKAGFELYNQNIGLAKNSLLQAFEILEKDNKLITLANEHWWIKFGSIVVKLGYVSWLVEIFEERGYDVVLSPYYTAIQALRIEQKENIENADLYLKNRAIEIGDPAKLIIEKIKKT